jgi:integrase
MSRKWLPDNVTEYRDRHGKRRYRFRKAGYPSYSFRHAPGTEEFREELQKAQTRVSASAGDAVPGSFNDLIAQYYETVRWKEMKPSSKKTYRSIIERFRAVHGDKPVARMETRHIDKILAGMAMTPAAANNLRKTLSRLFRHAIKLGWLKHNPVDATDAYRSKTDGFHTWTEAEIEQFEKHWPVGSRPRLAMLLMLYTALRRSDMVTVGEANLRGEHLDLSHRKNGSETLIRVLPPLAEALALVPSGQPAFLVTEFGKPFTAAGFGNWFRDRCNEAGLPHCSAHGLRKAMSRRLAESGATNQQGRAVTGHKTDRMFNHYAARANQEALADEGLANLSRRFGEPAGKVT